MPQKYVIAGLAIVISVMLMVATALSTFRYVDPFSPKQDDQLTGLPVVVGAPDSPLQVAEPGVPPVEDLGGLLGGLLDSETPFVLAPEPLETAPEAPETPSDVPVPPRVPSLSGPPQVPAPPSPVLSIPNLPAPIPQVFQSPAPEPPPGSPAPPPQPNLLTEAGEVVEGVGQTVGGVLGGVL